MTKQYKKKKKEFDFKNFKLNLKPFEFDVNSDIQIKPFDFEFKPIEIKPFDFDSDKFAKDLDDTFQKMREKINNFKIDIDFKNFNKD